ARSAKFNLLRVPQPNNANTALWNAFIIWNACGDLRLNKRYGEALKKKCGSFF
ncbi:Hypothetical protein FKW44_006024, partial [Caligus rogercresseyi]